MNSIKLTEKLHVLNAEPFPSQGPLLQRGPLKRGRPATRLAKAPGAALQPEGLCGIMSQAPVGSAFKILIQSILVTET